MEKFPSHISKVGEVLLPHDGGYHRFVVLVLVFLVVLLRWNRSTLLFPRWIVSLWLMVHTVIKLGLMNAVDKGLRRSEVYLIKKLLYGFLDALSRRLSFDHLSRNSE